MQDVELVLELLVGVAFLAAAAGRLGVPGPVLLVLGGLALALIPAVPDVELPPELVFLLFLPPLLYYAAFETSVRDVRALIRPIFSLAVGLVLATTLVVALVAHALLPELGWPTAFAMGAIVSPPDAVAAVAVFRGLGVPRRLLTLVESESLFNDATALVAYQAALAATATASFSAGNALLRFLVVGIGGILLGAVVGMGVAWLRRRLNDPSVEITVSLLTPFAAYLPAERLGVSGVLATVATGLCVGWWSPHISDSETRLRSRAVWDMVVFVLNGLVFILIGLQLSTIMGVVASNSLATLIGMGLLISLAAILVRVAWVFGNAYLPFMVRGAGGQRPDWRETLVVAWAGMRGVVSLATALALPLSTPDRDLVIFLTFCVILVTLVGQGLTLPQVVRRLGVSAGAGLGPELRARALAAEAAVSRLDELTEEWPTHKPLIDTLRAQYSHRVSHLVEPEPVGAQADGSHGDDAALQELREHQAIRSAVIDAERGAVLDLRDRGEIDDALWRRIERDLDLEQLRMEA
ncbi:MAG: Na+/H+ antiporter [Chloroflexi bacterium]|nr:Na+/H+ antiporter [Chloroflexota bacterium]